MKNWKFVAKSIALTLAVVICLSLTVAATRASANPKDLDDVLERYGIDSGDVSYYRIGDEKVDLGQGHQIQELRTDFKIDPSTGEVTSQKVRIDNVGLTDILIYTNSFKHLALRSPRVVSVDKFEDWNKLTQLETISNIAVGLNWEFMSVDDELTEQHTKLKNEEADYWFAAEKEQDSELLARVAPGESIIISLNSRFGKFWDEKATLQYHASLLIERDEDQYESELESIARSLYFKEDLIERIKESENSAKRNKSKMDEDRVLDSGRSPLESDETYLEDDWIVIEDPGIAADPEYQNEANEDPSAGEDVDPE